MRCFSGALAVFMGKVIEMLNLPAALHGRPATVTLAGAASTRRMLAVERSRAAWGRHCREMWQHHGPCPTLPTPALPAGSWLWSRPLHAQGP